ncbi:hypothetical protein IAE35_12760 [Pseudomonas sp. S75]|uniref:hypothetical protein n=1 Tax=unclassified Pseudomonas TaxID=196821 RepID=UPI001908AB45|nr:MULTISPECIES: hypothetical protein [unclassified Pseudomonas]MBJ9974479.1 hypothetical protein [Pseudomonas sp. S30]MBK0154212.1 hypothetical protein [Pseudomonas sp. S75]
MHLRSSLFCLCVFSSLGHAAVNCSALAEKISSTVPEFHPVRGGEVIGTGRVHFYTAPDEACANQKIFVVPGDSLIVYSILQDESWLEVNFVAKNGEDYTGWVKAERVKIGAPHGLPSDGE